MNRSEQKYSEQRALLQLRRLPRVGDARCADLLQKFGSARLALEGLRADGATVDASGEDWAAAQLARAAELGARFIAIDDEAYPELLRQIPDPPIYLFVRGREDLLREPGVAIVGSRRCTSYGKDVARRFGRDLAGRGVIVVSGLALGIAAAAHVGALEAGNTVAVLGCGADVPYPAAHRALYERVLAEGAIVSELPLGTKPQAGSFPRRNRIISGLSLGVIIAEAPQRSGALITARCAAEQNREVFAIPGEITNPRCAGCHSLLRDGACLVRDAQDVVDELWTRLPRQVQMGGGEAADAVADAVAVAENPVDDDAGRLLQLLETGAQHVDGLTRDSGMAPAQVLQLMLRLELAGMVEALPGGAYGRRR